MCYQARPIDVCDLKSQKDVLSQHLLNVISPPTIMLWHHQAKQMLIVVLGQVDLINLLLFDMADEYEALLEYSAFGLLLHFGIILVMLG